MDEGRKRVLAIVAGIRQSQNVAVTDLECASAKQTTSGTSSCRGSKRAIP